MLDDGVCIIHQCDALVLQFHPVGALLLKHVTLGSKVMDAWCKIKGDLLLQRQNSVKTITLQGEGVFILQLAAYVGLVLLLLLQQSLYEKKEINPFIYEY